jgi:phage terminase large subunit-like protein
VEWTTALPDWERRIVAGESLIPCAPLFPGSAEEGARYFGELKAVDVVGSPALREISRPWVMDWVRSIFGAYCGEQGHPDEGRRLIREWFLLVSKKNGKSTDAAGVMMTALLLNWRVSGEFGILAPTIEVANNAYHPARDMVKADPDLSALLHVQDHIRKITHRTTGATLQVVAADSETVAGKKWIGTFVDELWLFGKKPGAFKMLEEATGGMASRPEGFVIYASTQSDEAPAGVYRDKLMYARGVRDGRIVDKQFMPLLYEFPRKMVEKKAYLDPKNFYITNPNLGASVDEQFIVRKIEQVGEAGEDSQQTVFAKYLNIEIGLNLQSDRWAGADFWEACGGDLTLDKLIERSEVIVVGIDGGGLDDLLGLSVMGRERETGRWLHWAHAWAHKIVLERRKEIAALIQDFANDGDLTIVDTPGDDVTQVADIVCRIRDAGLLPEKNAVGVDAAGIGDIVDELVSDARGILMEQIIAISQGWRLNGAIKTAERKVAGREFRHCSSKMMAWCVGNARVEDKGNAISITKQASGKAKIDPLMATFDAVSLLAMNPQPNTPQLFV